MEFVQCPECFSAYVVLDPFTNSYICQECGHIFNSDTPDTKKFHIPFVETHITGPIIVIDITFTNGDISRMNFCYNFTFENNTLTLVKDVAHKHKEVIENVSKMEVIAIQH